MNPLPYRIDAVLFDFDGTLTRPGALDFSAFKRKIGCPQKTPVLEFMQGLPDRHRVQEIAAKLDLFELSGAERSRPNTGATSILSAIKTYGLPVGILTRNSRDSVLRSLERFPGLAASDFGTIITREDPVEIKPSGEGVLLAAQRLCVNPENLLVVGDFHFDMAAGAAAGALTAYLSNGENFDSPADAVFVIETLLDLKPILEEGLSLPAGKLPNAFLDELLSDHHIDDPSVIVGPSVGEDTAAVDIEGESVLVLKSDPITFATESIGKYAVSINANDLATAGTEARWMLATLLLPCGFTKSQVRQIFSDLGEACSSEKVTLCGGHTEITDAVSRPVVAGTMAGTVAREDLIRKNRMSPGDRVLVTKGVAVEGTAIIAAEFREKLLQGGMRSNVIDDCRRFTAMLSILPEARIAWAVDGVSALHDVTEGGIATALAELSLAGGYGIRVRLDAVPVYPQTQRMGEILGIDPLGLIGSGSLLISCRPDSVAGLRDQVTASRIDIVEIGEVTNREPGIDATAGNVSVQWPHFEVDEITRLFQ
jgi:HAD superfamily hydrolase (TIGR01509 family)